MHIWNNNDALVFRNCLETRFRHDMKDQNCSGVNTRTEFRFFDKNIFFNCGALHCAWSLLLALYSVKDAEFWWNDLHARISVLVIFSGSHFSFHTLFTFLSKIKIFATEFLLLNMVMVSVHEKTFLITNSGCHSVWTYETCFDSKLTLLRSYKVAVTPLQ